MEKDPKFKLSRLEKFLLPPMTLLAVFLVWAISCPNQFIDLSLKLNKAWESVLTFLLTPIK